MAAAAVAVAVETQTKQDTRLLPLTRLLDDLVTVLLQVDPDAYVARPVPAVSGSIGQHVRHILDHVSVFAQINGSALVTYDTRERGTAVETDPGAAIRVILGLKMSLAHRRTLSSNAVVDVDVRISRSQSVIGRSSVARELAYVVSHTIHHQALIAILLALQGYGAPTDFGVAPSTPRFGHS
jgi:uncharacterized damage-inducible protein DinB